MSLIGHLLLTALLVATPALAHSESATREAEIEQAKVADAKIKWVTQALTIDKRDREACETIMNLVNNDQLTHQDLCQASPEKPYVVLLVTRRTDLTDEAEIRRSLWKMPAPDQLSPMKTQVRNYLVIGAGTMALFSALPPSVTMWTDEKKRNVFQNYAENIRNGPVWDKDKAFFNYVAHPYVGAIYYTSVRHLGYSALESATFSVMMSTFFWEYGFEAVAEKPSRQDLLITPIIGSVLGELAYGWAKDIEADGGRVLGSRPLGQAVQVFLNPAGALASSINRLFENRVVQSSEIQLRTFSRPAWSDGRKTTSTGLFLELKY